MRYKLGKKDHVDDDRDLRLTKYLRALPKPPNVFGHDRLVETWGMLGNDRYGDCVWAGAAHEHMLWNIAAGRLITPFREQDVLSDYAALTGFNPRDPNSDQGTDMRQACGYRRSRGIVDATGTRHKIGAYIALDAGDIEQLKIATYLFGAVGVGIQFPSTAMDEFDEGGTWSYHRNAQIEGGHYIPVVAWRHGHPICITWGREQPMSKAFFENYCDEAFVMVATDQLDKTGRTPEGFNVDQLNADLTAVTSA